MTNIIEPERFREGIAARDVREESPEPLYAPRFFLVYVQGASKVLSVSSYSKAITERARLMRENPDRIVWICPPDKGRVLTMMEREVLPEQGGTE